MFNEKVSDTRCLQIYFSRTLFYWRLINYRLDVILDKHDDKYVYVKIIGCTDHDMDSSAAYKQKKLDSFVNDLKEKCNFNFELIYTNWVIPSFPEADPRDVALFWEGIFLFRLTKEEFDA